MKTFDEFVNSGERGTNDYPDGNIRDVLITRADYAEIQDDAIMKNKKHVDRKTKIEQTLAEAQKICRDSNETRQAWLRLCRELEFMAEPEARMPRFRQLLHAIWIAASGDQT